MRTGRDSKRPSLLFLPGGTGFGIGDGGNEEDGWMGGGHSGFLGPLPQWFKEFAIETAGFGRSEGGEIIAGAFALDELNNRVFSPFRNVSAIRVENMFSMKPISYQLYLRYRQWNLVKPRDRGIIFKKLHDVTGKGNFK